MIALLSFLMAGAEVQVYELMHTRFLFLTGLVYTISGGMQG